MTRTSAEAPAPCFHPLRGVLCSCHRGGIANHLDVLGAQDPPAGSYARQRRCWLAALMGCWRSDPAEDHRAHLGLPFQLVMQCFKQKSEENTQRGEFLCFYLLKTSSWNRLKGKAVNVSPSFGFSPLMLVCVHVPRIAHKEGRTGGGCTFAGFSCATIYSWCGNAAHVDCQRCI